jgi:hypothetical protein
MEETNLASVSLGFHLNALIGVEQSLKSLSPCLACFCNARYNKVEKDFPNLLEYNNYLEEVEDISELNMSGES